MTILFNYNENPKNTKTYESVFYNNEKIKISSEVKKIIIFNKKQTENIKIKIPGGTFLSLPDEEKKYISIDVDIQDGEIEIIKPNSPPGRVMRASDIFLAIPFTSLELGVVNNTAIKHTTKTSSTLLGVDYYTYVGISYRILSGQIPPVIDKENKIKLEKLLQNHGQKNIIMKPHCEEWGIEDDFIYGKIEIKNITQQARTLWGCKIKITERF